ncbi:hypothetical protein O3M35_000074 [Rhynocoris fuscipes]|uniref:Uncharacterized protein n=1 Tax=Rhynocoris fuscipes TaxID=488301 RepID=A0AAW1DQG8_9HEMI
MQLLHRPRSKGANNLVQRVLSGIVASFLDEFAKLTRLLFQDFVDSTQQSSTWSYPVILTHHANQSDVSNEYNYVNTIHKSFYANQNKDKDANVDVPLGCHHLMADVSIDTDDVFVSNGNNANSNVNDANDTPFAPCKRHTISHLVLLPERGAETLLPSYAGPKFSYREDAV